MQLPIDCNIVTVMLFLVVNWGFTQVAHKCNSLRGLNIYLTFLRENRTEIKMWPLKIKRFSINEISGLPEKQPFNMNCSYYYGKREGGNSISLLISGHSGIRVPLNHIDTRVREIVWINSSGNLEMFSTNGKWLWTVPLIFSGFN